MGELLKVTDEVDDVLAVVRLYEGGTSPG